MTAIDLQRKVEAGAQPEPTLPPCDEIAAAHLTDETRLVGGLIERAVFTEDERRRADVLARELVAAVRANTATASGLEAFTQEYGLSSDEGVLLMCVAESLLRIPDAATADKLIAEKLGEGSWAEHLGKSDSFYVNASTWGLLLTGRVVRSDTDAKGAAVSALRRLVAKSGEPLIRRAVRRAVEILGRQFVLGCDIDAALRRGKALEAKGYLLSYDMLGEAAHTEADASRYFERYMAAIEAVGVSAGVLENAHPKHLMQRPGVSIKLSALHPRFEAGKEARLVDELVPRVMQLVKAAQHRGLPVTFDMEEQDRLGPSLDVFGRVFLSPDLANWNGLGIAVQAYSKRAVPVLRWLRQLARQGGRIIPVRLVKGAYWDSEIKWAQQRGWENYPVFTRKLHTDVSYLACARLLLSDPQVFYPQFATHNAATLAAVHVAAGNQAVEYQRLHGMGETLYDQVIGPKKLDRSCRIYAPVGGHQDLLAYLVRRLLENGANTSFVNQMGDVATPVDEIVADPVGAAEADRAKGLSQQWRTVPQPIAIYAPERLASSGLALSERTVRDTLLGEMSAALSNPFAVGPVVAGKTLLDGGAEVDRFCPHDFRALLGTLAPTTDAHIEDALAAATGNAHRWQVRDVEERAAMLELAADRLEKQRARFMAVLVREAGKTLHAAHDEVREAVDFLRFYASEARRQMSEPVSLKSPTGETNTLSLHGRGPFAVICPWNFPLAIAVGQASAALVTGNPVVLKPAEQTPIIGHLTVELLHGAGVPVDVLHLLPGDGGVGAKLVGDPRVCGVAFTGSQETAWAIQMDLARRRSAIVPFIAETGGVNAMIADSTSLPEQVVRDCVRSAFDSAGQRCSAARVLFVQNDVADRTFEMLAGSVAMLDLGDPMDYATDIGPVIDEVAQDGLEAHKLHMRRVGREVVDAVLPEPCRDGNYVAPAVYELDRVDVIEGEMFGPLLHVVRYQGGHLDKVVSAINGMGYGLTLGLHSRLDSVADQVARDAKVGNLYVNRDQVGAVVGVQPFGGEGLSGTGPKAGGPNYLMRFMTERVRSTDITATGGNAQLLRMAGAKRD